MNIYIGNLSYDVTNDDLLKAFKAFGDVTSANIIVDRSTGAPRGFGFVEMSSRDSAQAAIAGLNGTLLKGRAITVNEARQRQSSFGNRGGSGGGGRFGRGGGRRY
ncbi:MAG TPA: RNA-binding protein [Deltaproteobacteria bacterium]|jgi:RNA recognition motif-containing protein|nr:RNA-binding protein [Deltaproteobacteria bacterium]HOI05967.1 RNA-binding protein [Deltaproteobacteria bacterium]